MVSQSFIFSVSFLFKLQKPFIHSLERFATIINRHSRWLIVVVNRLIQCMMCISCVLTTFNKDDDDDDDDLYH